MDSGQALLDLGDTTRAHNLITEGERLLPSARDMTRSVFLTHRAASYLDLEEPEHAAAAATQSPLLAVASTHPAASALSTTRTTCRSPSATTDTVPAPPPWTTGPGSSGSHSPRAFPAGTRR
ncbi:hypothetical protein ACFYZB_20025 [Streptomyces sp. NPDC001852]|uniref:hypothetical protein n=1 Tax=Streptomyces sp. NPDC001852 TaxID=3364619 RepID=UPI0036A411DC